MNAKRWIALGAAVLMSVSLAACGETEDDGSFNYSKGLDENGFFKGIKASKIVTLPEYKGIDIDKAITVASEEDVQEQINNVMADYITYEEITNRTVEDGDTVNIDYVGYVDGVEFEGGSTGGAGTTVTIGVTQYVDEFLSQLLGRIPGETFDVNVTFPENYGNETVDGKDAVFVTTINYIQGDAIVPDVTDDIAAGYGFATADELIADIENWLILNQKYTFFSELLAEATCTEIPQAVLDYVMDYDMAMLENYASTYGMTGEEYLTAYGYESVQAYIDENASLYEETAVMYLAAQAIAEIEGITVSDEELEAAGLLELEEEYGLPSLRQSLLFQEILPDFIVQSGNVK